jgi:hypothetical protein
MTDLSLMQGNPSTKSMVVSPDCRGYLKRLKKAVVELQLLHLDLLADDVGAHVVSDHPMRTL